MAYYHWYFCVHNKNAVVEGQRDKQGVSSGKARKEAEKCSTQAPESACAYLEAKSTIKKDTSIKINLGGKYVSLSSYDVRFAYCEVVAL